MGYNTIEVNKDNHIVTITMNRPEMLNAINTPMVEELTLAIREVDKDDDARVLVLTGAGSAFCAGADFQFSKVREGEVEVDQAEEVRGMILKDIGTGRLLRGLAADVILAIQRLDKPTIAMVNGNAVGGGLDIALACDIRYGSENTRFTIGYTKLGLVPYSGSAWLLPRIVGLPKAAELLYSGDIITGKEAAEIGLLNKVAPSTELESVTMNLASKIANGPPIANRLSKLLLYKCLSTNFEDALAFSAAAVNLTFSTEDTREGVKAFAEKRPPVFKGE